jgi:anaerobic ribonucleoside-triphosphate reductase
MNTHAPYANTLTRWIQVTNKKIKTEIYSRVSGYYRPVAQWNKGKQEEFENRKALQMTKRDQA